MTRRVIFLLIFFLGLSGFSWAQSESIAKHLAVNGSAELSKTEFIADNDINYDMNGNLSSGILLVSELKNLNYESSLGILKKEDHSEGELIYLSPNERVLTIFHDGYEDLKISLVDIGIDLEPGQVWKVSIEEKRTEQKSGELVVTEELHLLEYEIISDRDGNKDERGILTAGIKIYSELDKLTVRQTEKVIKVQEGSGEILVYVSTDIDSLEVMSEGRDPVKIDLSDVVLESGKIYGIKIE